MSINKIISQLDELNGMIGDKDIEINKDYIPQECALFIKTIVENYSALRKAALDGERYRKAGEALVEVVIGTTGVSVTEDFSRRAEKLYTAIEAYRQAVEQKEV